MNKQNKFIRQVLVAFMLFIFTATLFSNNLFNHSPSYNEQTHQLDELKEKTALPVVHAEEPTKVPGTTEEEFTPNTSNLHPQWNHNIMNIGQAWADGYTGVGISIAVLDTGFFIQHPDSSIVGGYSVFSDDPWSNDHSGHGTHIAGIISAKRGSPYQGIAPDAEVFGIKMYHEEDVSEDGDVSTDVKSVIKGIQYAIDLDRKSVV